MGRVVVRDSNPNLNRSIAPLSTSCWAQLLAAEACIEDEPTCNDPICGMFNDSFVVKFPGRVSKWFEAAVYEDPWYYDRHSQDFCLQTNYHMCAHFDPYYEGPASCCCIPETKEYVNCMIQEEFMTKYKLGPCKYEGCELFEKEEENRSLKLFAIGGVASAAILVVDFVLIWYCRKRRAKSTTTASADVEDEEESSEKKKEKDITEN